MRKAKYSLAMVLGLLAMTLAGREQDNATRRPSTPEERARLVAIAHSLEAAPLNKALVAEREWAIKWLIQVPDLTVSLCPSVLGRDFLRTKYKYRPELTAQLMLSSAAFMIEHPDLAAHKVAQYAAGADGALRAYAAILKDNPKARWGALDEAMEKQGNGQLVEFVRQNSAGCK